MTEETQYKKYTLKIYRGRFMTEETQYKKYTLKIDGKPTYVYACKNLTEKEAKEDIKNRFGTSKITNIKLS